ncbi:MAG: transcriptional regulator, partial [Leptospiraceae bacterium]|nr:transcriptional regulator [Leptospiraceae bacterium]
MKIETFFRHFLLTPVNYLPVIDEEKNLLGLLSKEKIQREMADLASEGEEYLQIPPHLLDKEINENVIYYFQNFRTIPVLNIYSQRVDAWEKPRFLAEVSKLLESGKQEEIVEEEEEEKSNEPQSKLLIYKFMELILRNFPDALYATDKDGNTTFYNEKFETTVLSRNIFRDSIT